MHSDTKESDRKLFGQEELIQLWRRDGRPCKHRVDLSSMVDLVLEEVKQDVAYPFGLNMGLALE